MVDKDGDAWLVAVGSQRDGLGKGVEGLLEFWIVLEEGADLGDCMEDGGMVLAAKRSADFGEGSMGELASEVHGDLTRESHRLGAVFGAHVGELDAEELGRLPLDVLDGDDLLFFSPEFG